ncbi:MAG: ATP-binding protein [Gaiellaceae bacterium]
MKIPGGIRVRLALGLVAIVAGALGTAYLIVVPSLEKQLVDARLDELEQQAVPLAGELPADTLLWNDKVEEFAVAANARVVAFGVLEANSPALAVVADSRRGQSSRDVARNGTALEAAKSGDLERGRVVDATGDYAEVAVPRGEDAVVLFRASLADSLATVRLVERRLLVATGFALVLALVLGLTAAGMFAHRLRRLEAAAERIAGGNFDAPIVDRGDDEIGQLAATFDGMRVQLSQLDNARKEFVANASHELRTPLFSIGGFLELMTEEELDAETQNEFLSTMRSQVERLTKLSTDLLDLSRVDAGQLSVEREPVDLSAVVTTLARELEHVAIASGHLLDTEHDDDAWCTADEERVLQIGRALVVNGVVHTPAGTRIVLRARRRGSRVELQVADDGPGIPSRQREAVFERFYRVEGGGKASGSGLGLAIARELARLMNGAVRLESGPEGTVVTLELPSAERLEPARAPARPFSRENDADGE